MKPRFSRIRRFEQPRKSGEIAAVRVVASPEGQPPAIANFDTYHEAAAYIAALPSGWRWRMTLFCQSTFYINMEMHVKIEGVTP